MAELATEQAQVSVQDSEAQLVIPEVALDCKTVADGLDKSYWRVCLHEKELSFCSEWKDPQ